MKKSLGKYGPASVEDTTGSGAADAKDDDDIDLFGSDDEEVWPAVSVSMLVRQCGFKPECGCCSHCPGKLALGTYMMNETKSPSFG